MVVLQPVIIVQPVPQPVPQQPQPAQLPPAERGAGNGVIHRVDVRPSLGPALTDWSRPVAGADHLPRALGGPASSCSVLRCAAK